MSKCFFKSHHMTMHKVFVAIGLFFLIAPFFSFGQCDIKIDYSFKKSASAYKIYLNSNGSVNGVRVQLYDLNQGKIIAEKVINLQAKDIEVFTNVKSSVYTINLKIEGCDKKQSLGGLNGINIR
jgi:hypothetical protein